MIIAMRTLLTFIVLLSESSICALVGQVIAYSSEHMESKSEELKSNLGLLPSIFKQLAATLVSSEHWNYMEWPFLQQLDFFHPVNDIVSELNTSDLDISSLQNAVFLMKMLLYNGTIHVQRGASSSISLQNVVDISNALASNPTYKNIKE
jgi:hypothetical protein